MIKKALLGLVFLVIILAVVLVGGRNFIVKAAVTAGVKAVTGLKLDIASLNIGLRNTLIAINGLKLYNPAGFPDALMVDLPEIYVDYDLNAFLKQKKIHLQEVRLDLNEFLIIKNKDGILNLDSLKPVQAAKTEETAPEKPQAEKPAGKAPEIQIDVLRLKLNKVIVKDYSAGKEPKISEYALNLDERYENITDAKSIVNIIVLKAMSNAAIAKFADLDLGGLSAGLKGTVGDAGDLLQGLGKSTGGTAADTVKQTTQKLKSLFGK